MKQTFYYIRPDGSISQGDSTILMVVSIIEQLYYNDYGTSVISCETNGECKDLLMFVHNENGKKWLPAE